MLIPLWTSTTLRRFPLVVAVLVVANLALFMATRSQLDAAVERWGFLPPSAADARLPSVQSLRTLQTLVSHAFLHAGWLHLIGNMWVLVVFGIAVESRTGSLVFAGLYLALVVLAIAAHTLLSGGAVRPAIGASGAVSGIIGCYVALEPRSRVLSFLFLGITGILTEVPSLFWVAVWLVLQIDGISSRVLTGPECQNIAWWAHLGGFSAGLAIGVALRRIANPTKHRSPPRHGAMCTR